MDQLKILFVDDEVLVRVGLSSIINWNKYGCVVIGDAPSAEKALEIIDKERPHVIFTDILMPQMSGIELIKKVRERYGENIYIVILTSHDEFEYAHQAIRYGVTDYVLKFSLTSESILAILEKIRGCIKKTGSLPKTQEIHVAEQRSTNRFFINILLENINAPASEIDELMQRLSIPFAYTDGRYVVCAVSVLELSKKVLAGKIIDEIKFLDNFNQILMNKLMIFGIKEIFPVNNNTYVFMTEIQQEKNQIQEIISTINFAAETYLNCSLFMGVSLPCDSVGMLATGTVQALAAREQQFYTHETNLCVFEEKQQPDIMEIFSPKAEDELYHSLLLLQTDHAIAVIEHCLNVCKKHQVSMSGIDTLLERINL
ncbi:MAG: response regulator, partial [Christensenellaceae bacterium]